MSNRNDENLLDRRAVFSKLFERSRSVPSVSELLFGGSFEHLQYISNRVQFEKQVLFLFVRILKTEAFLTSFLQCFIFVAILH